MATTDLPLDANTERRVGYIAIVGRPNVGKSTLMNCLIGQKISIVSSKAQTTRHRITGITTRPDAQFIFVDTPGFQTKHLNSLNRAMNRSVTQTLASTELIFIVVEAGRFSEEDERVIACLPTTTPVILVLSKIDLFSDKNELLPFMEKMQKRFAFAEIVPVSANKELNTKHLLDTAAGYLPLGPLVFDEEELTDRSERFLAAEFLREKLFRLLGDELPYALSVEIERFETEGELRRINAAVIVDREAHKGMVIGRKGEHLKRIASEARIDLEQLLGGKVYLEVWVKVRGGWADDERALKSLGYD